VTGNVAHLFTKNQRIKATITAGVIVGTIKWATVSGSVTTVACSMGGAFDSGLSSILLGTLTPEGAPVPLYKVYNDSYALAAADVNRTLGMYNNTAPTSFTLPSLTAFPTSGTWIRFVNEGPMPLTIVGKTSLGTDVILDSKDVLNIYSDNNHWFGSLTPAKSYAVKATFGDGSPGFLDSKVDGSTVSVVNNLLTSPSSQWFNPQFTGLTAYDDNSGFSVDGNMTAFLQKGRRVNIKTGTGYRIGTIWVASFDGAKTNARVTWSVIH